MSNYRFTLLTGLLTLTLSVPSVLIPTSLFAESPTVNSAQTVTKRLPASVLRSIQTDIQKRFRVAPQNIQVSTARQMTWDGCMGLPLPNRACTAIAIPGWQVVVTNRAKNRFWVYHTNQDGKTLAYNAAASLPRNAKINPPSFIKTDKIIPTSGDAVIFQSAQITGFSPAYYAWELTNNGTLTRRQISRNPGKPEIVRKLSKKELQEFTQTLDNNSFLHFNQLSYVDMGAIAADAVSYQLSYNSAVVEYTDNDLQQFPNKLNRIITAWNRIIAQN